MSDSSRDGAPVPPGGGDPPGGKRLPPDPQVAVPTAADIPTLMAARDAAVREHEEVAALLLRETLDARATEAHLRDLIAEREHLHREIADLRARVDPAFSDTPRIQDLQRQAEHQSRATQELHERLAESERERQRLSHSNDHLATEVALAGAEIHGLQEERANAERDRQEAEEEHRLAECAVNRTQEALEKAEAELASVAVDPPAHHQRLDNLARERDRAVAALDEATTRMDRLQADVQALQRLHREARTELNQLRAVHMATLADLDRAVREQSAPELARLQKTHDTTIADLAQALRARDQSRQEADRLRARVTKLEEEADIAEQTMNTLGRRVQSIEAERRGLSKDLTRMSSEHDALDRAHAAALRQLTMITAMPSIRPAAVEEVLDPAFMLSLLRTAPPDSASSGPVSERSQPSGGGSGSSTSKRDRDVAESTDPTPNPDPNPTPPARRRIFQSTPPGSPDRDAQASGGHPTVDQPDGGDPDPERPEAHAKPLGKAVLNDDGADDESDDEEDDEETSNSIEGSEDPDTAAVTNELFEAQTLEAISQSRSAERRRQHASPRRQLATGGAGEPPDGSDDSDPPSRPDPRGHHADPNSDNQPDRPDPLAPVAPFGPEERCIPGREHARVLVLVDCNPSVVARLNNVAMVSMLVGVLFPVLPTTPGWLFPYLDREDRPSYGLGDYCHELITKDNANALYATKPWEVLENNGDAISFEPAVGGRLGVWIQKYGSYEEDNIVSYWESTHSFPIPDVMVAKDPWLQTFQKERDNRRSHAGRAWKHLLELLIVVMREGWCDLDILLDPYILHFPKRSETVKWYPGVVSRQANLADSNLHRPEPTDLLEALDECNEADPWRNRYRDTPQYHPARNIARLPAKFYDLRAVGDVE